MYKEFCAIQSERIRFIHAIDFSILYNTCYWGAFECDKTNITPGRV